MAKSSRYYRCIQEIQNRAGGKLSEDELADLADLLEERAAQLHRSGRTAAEAIDQATAEEASEQVTAGKLAKRAQYKMATAFAKFYQKMTANWADDPRAGYGAFQVGAKVARTGAGGSVHAAQITALAERVGAFHADLLATGKFKLFKSGVHDLDAYKALWQMDRGNQDMSGISREGRELAEVVYKYREELRLALNKVGAWIPANPDFITHQGHDMFKIRRAVYETTHSNKGFGDRSVTMQSWKDFYNTNREANYRAYSDFTRPLLDESKTFKGVTEENNEKFFRRAANNLASGDHMKADQTKDGFAMPASLARKLSEPRVLHFKDAESRYKYDQMFGRGGNLIERTTDQMSHLTRSIELMRAYGPNPDLQHQRYKNAIRTMVEDTAGGKGAFSWKRDEAILDANFAILNGEASIPGMDPVSTTLRTMRFANVLSKLKNMVFSSLTDMTAIHGELNYQGIKGLQNWKNQFDILTTSYKRGNKRVNRFRQMSELGVTIDQLGRGSMSNFAAQDSLSMQMGRLQHLYMTLNFGLWWTDSKRMGLARGTSNHLAMLADHPYAALPKETARLFKIYDIKEREWDLMRDRAVATLDGFTYLNPKGARNITDPEIASLLEDEQLKPTPLRISERREDIERKFRTLIGTRGIQGVMHAEARGQRIITGMAAGIKPGTPGGEMAKSWAQFKSFPTAIIEKVFGRELYGYGEDTSLSARSVWNATKEGGGIIALTKFIVYSTFLGYLSLQIKAYTAGRVLDAPRNFDDWRRQIQAAFVQGAAFGIYSDFVLGHAKDRYGHAALDDLMGPVFNQAQDLYTLVRGVPLPWGLDYGGPSGQNSEFKMIHTDQAAMAQRWRMLRNNFPLLNQWYTQAAWDYLILNTLQESMSPGSLQRMEKSMRDEMNINMRVPMSSKLTDWTSDDFKSFASPTGR